MRTSAFLTVLQGSWCSPLSPDPCTADRSHHTGGTFCDPCTLLQTENNSKTTCLFPWKTNFKITLCFLQCLPFFFSFVYQLRYVFAHFFLSFFLSSLLEWLELSLWCVLVAPIINSQLFLFSLRWRSSSLSSSFWHLPHKNSFSVCCRLLFVLFLYHVQILFVGFETKHCTVWKCHSLANSLWVFLQ